MTELADVLLSMQGGFAYQQAERKRLNAVVQADAMRRAAEAQAAQDQWERNMRAGEALLVRAGRDRSSFIGRIVQR